MLVRWFVNFLLALSRRIRTLAPLLLFLGCVFLHGGCTSCTVETPPLPLGVIACKPQHPTLPTASQPVSEASDIETVSAGTIPVSFSTTSAAMRLSSFDCDLSPGEEASNPPFR
jgi:hypothetical protein